MKVASSIKSAKLRDKINNYTVRRGKKIFVYNKKKPRFKIRQGS